MDKTIYFLSKCIKYAKNFLLILFALILLTSGNKASNETRILFVGDILLSRNINLELESRKLSPWKNLSTLFSSADFIAGNLEGAVGDNIDQINPMFNSPVFAIDNTNIPLLKDAGFTALSIQNNHSFDLGKNGRDRTLNMLIKNSLNPVQLINSPQFFTIKDLVLSLVAINLVPGRDSLKDSIPSVEISQKLRLARRLSNIVVVSIHWGSELMDWPNKKQREIAKWLIKNGADIIIGSHPHVIQKPELIDGKPVFFSLGNNLFDQKYPATKEGLIADIRIKNGKFYCSGLLTHCSENSFYPKLVDTINFEFDSIVYQTELLRINNYELKPLSVYHMGENRIVLKAFKDGKFLWDSPPLPLITISANKLDGEKYYLFALENRFSTLDNRVTLRPYVYSLDDNGIIANWRGSALAWPLIDAFASSLDNSIIYALHRGDSFVVPDVNDTSYRVALYKWNGFGFSGINDSLASEYYESKYWGWPEK